MSTTTLQQTAANTNRGINIPFLSGFMNWAKSQEDNRILWVGIALVVHGCALTPLTVMAVVFAGLNMYLFMLAITAMAMALVTNLAAMPTKVTIPVFALSVFLDIAIVIACFFSGFNLTNGI